LLHVDHLLTRAFVSTIPNDSGNGSCTFSLNAGEELDISIYTRSTAGAKFAVTNAAGNSTFVDNFEVKHLGSDDLTETPTRLSLTGDNKITGPQQIKVKADSNAGRWSTSNFLVVFTVYAAK